MADFAQTIAIAYATDGAALDLVRGVHDGAVVTAATVKLPLRMVNRHGLIAGATGTGKTKTLQGIAEQLSSAGVPVFVADVKGDLSGVAEPGDAGGAAAKRAQELGLQFQAGIAKFDRKTEKFQVWSLPPELNGDHVQINQVSPDRSYVDNKVWLQDAGTYTVLRLDPGSGKFDVFEPYAIPRPNV